jgi:hypothetical protein
VKTAALPATRPATLRRSVAPRRSASCCACVPASAFLPRRSSCPTHPCSTGGPAGTSRCRRSSCPTYPCFAADRPAPLRCATALCFLASLVYRPRHQCLGVRCMQLTRVPAFAACGSPWASPFGPAFGGSRIVPAIFVARSLLAPRKWLSIGRYQLRSRRIVSHAGWLANLR